MNDLEYMDQWILFLCLCANRIDTACIGNAQLSSLVDLVFFFFKWIKCVLCFCFVFQRAMMHQEHCRFSFNQLYDASVKHRLQLLLRLS